MKRSYMMVGIVTLVMFIAGCGSVGGGSSTTYIPTLIMASWSGGAAGPPTDRTDVEAEKFIGQMCPASSLTLINYGDEFAGLQLINSCTIRIDYVACVSKGSLPQPDIGGLDQCATDPLDTPISQLTFKSLDPGNLGDFINTTQNLSVNIMFCSDDQQICAPPLCDSIECM